MLVNLRAKRARALQAIALCALPSSVAYASDGNGTVYPLGADTVAPGMLPAQPGLYYQHYTAYYDAERTDDVNGEPVPNFNLEVIGNAERFLYVTRTKIAGGSVVLQTIIPHADISLRAGPISQHKYQLGDVSVGAFLSWHGKKLHGWLGPNVYFPTGGYTANDPVNVGRNVMTFSLQGGVTYFVTPKLDVGVKGYIATNTKNAATDYRSGDELALEYLAAHRVTPKVRIGIQGYYYDQMSDDRIAGTAVPGGNQGKAFAVGPMVSFNIGKFQVALKHQEELYAENRARGRRFWLQTMIPIG
jgi:hypothetical protein